MQITTKTLVAGVATLSLALISDQSLAETFSLDSTKSTRVVSGTANSRDDNNGGAQSGSSSLLGINTGGVDNFVIYDFDLSSLVGLTVTGNVTLTIDPSPGAVADAGSSTDTVSVAAIFADNAGWLEGTGTITGSDNLTDDGSASFLNRVQFNDDPGAPSGTTTPWLDDSGAGVSNLLGAITGPFDTLAGSTTGYSFTIDQATAQGWIDNGFAGLALYATDLDSDGKARFSLNTSANLSLEAVPEPGSLALLGLGGLLIARRRRS